MNIVVIGIGGVGGYFGGKIARFAETAPNLKVYFVARGPHLAAIRDQGLILDADEGVTVCKPTLATDRFEDLPSADVCLLCVKAYDLIPALRALRPKVGPKTVILPLMNGIDIYERIREEIGTGIILPACVYVGTHIERPGKVTQRGGTCRIFLGSDPRTRSISPELLNLFDRASINYTVLEDPYREIWSKFVFVAAFGLTAAAYGRTMGEVLNGPDSRKTLGKILSEAVAIARRLGISLPQAIEAEILARGEAFPPDTKPSFQRDYETGSGRDERDIFGGTLVRLGVKTGVPTPETEKILQSFHPPRISL